ncbi:MAG: DEAD/DEAH box helicase [Burkholderiaceae bacterium]|jgi:ATP-dependent RNA helicase RhlE|nr:DEAD/DEAH box helicase [Burkholderiaceae bacterium]
MNFEELNLAAPILQAVQEQGYTHPTPIQQQAIPAILEGHDLLAGAQTGTGKTAAFTLPMLQLLGARAPRQDGAIRSLVLTPTRELAAQVEEAVRTYGKHLRLTSTVIFGGVGQNPQVQRIRRGVDILVATPGRLLDLEQQDHIDLSHVEILVLDEADRMLDMGFIHDVKKVLALLPRNKQSLLFSATFGEDIRALAAGLLNQPKNIQVTPPNSTVERIAQVIYPVGRERKKDVLAHLIEQSQWSQVLIFTRTKFGANKVADDLCRRGIKAMALHGNKSQTARTQALGEFKSGELRALVATDIAARGIDIDELPHVVNYDIPNVPEDYVHRIGRTGRAGASGEAVSLVCMDEEGFMHAIEKFTRQQIPVRILDGYGPAEGEHALPIAMGRQTLWGGLGQPPGREVMQAAARAARQEMMQRIREGKPRQSQDARPGGRARFDASEPPRQSAQDLPANENALPAGAEGSGAPGEDRNNRPRPRRRRIGRLGGDLLGSAGQARNQAAQQRREQRRGDQNNGDRDRDDDREPDHLPRHIDPLQTNLHGRRNAPRNPGYGGAPGQPDPMRTSIDMMGGGKRKRGNGDGGNRRGGFSR